MPSSEVANKYVKQDGAPETGKSAEIIGFPNSQDNKKIRQAELRKKIALAETDFETAQAEAQDEAKEGIVEQIKSNVANLESNLAEFNLEQIRQAYAGFSRLAEDKKNEFSKTPGMSNSAKFVKSFLEDLGEVKLNLEKVKIKLQDKFLPVVLSESDLNEIDDLILANITDLARLKLKLGEVDNFVQKYLKIEKDTKKSTEIKVLKGIIENNKTLFEAKQLLDAIAKGNKKPKAPFGLKLKSIFSRKVIDLEHEVEILQNLMKRDIKDYPALKAQTQKVKNAWSLQEY